MRVIVTGGRDYKDRTRVCAELNASSVTHLMVGDCPTGADHFAREWWESGEAERMAHRRVTRQVFEAFWTAQGRAAGPIRNGRMVAAGADLVLAFPGGRGTADCVRQARAAGIPVKEIV